MNILKFIEKHLKAYLLFYWRNRGVQNSRRRICFISLSPATSSFSMFFCPMSLNFPLIASECYGVNSISPESVEIYKSSSIFLGRACRLICVWQIHSLCSSESLESHSAICWAALYNRRGCVRFPDFQILLYILTYCKTYSLNLLISKLVNSDAAW